MGNPYTTTFPANGISGHTVTFPANYFAVVKGKRVNVGGWGAEIADEGSGMAIGLTAIRRSLWALEGMAPMTPLAEDVLSVFDRDPQKMVVWAGTATPGDFGSFAPRVFTHAVKRDVLAVPILLEAAADASRMINRLLDLGAPAVAMIGGIFPHLLPWLPPVLVTVMTALPAVSLVTNEAVLKFRRPCGKSPSIIVSQALVTPPKAVPFMGCWAVMLVITRRLSPSWGSIT